MHYSSIEFEIRRYVNDGDISEIKDILELVDEDKDNIIQIGMGICCYDDVPSLYLFTSSVPENNIEERTVRKYFCDFSDDEGWERFVSVIKQLDNEYKNIKQSANCEVGEIYALNVIRRGDCLEQIGYVQIVIFQNKNQRRMMLNVRR